MQCNEQQFSNGTPKMSLAQAANHSKGKAAQAANHSKGQARDQAGPDEGPTLGISASLIHYGGQFTCINFELIRAKCLTVPVMQAPGGGDSRVERTGLLVGNFENKH